MLVCPRLLNYEELAPSFKENKGDKASSRALIDAYKRMWTDTIHSTSAVYEEEVAMGSPRKNVDAMRLLDESELNGRGWNKPAKLSKLKEQFMLKVKGDSEVIMSH